MQLRDKVIVVTGGGNGIGKALCERFQQDQPDGIVVADIEVDRAAEVAESISAVSVSCDVGKESEIEKLIGVAMDEFGRIDVFCSNAGVGGSGGVEAPNEMWDHVFAVNFHAHLYAARHVLPQMIDRGSGYLMNTISAAGLLTSLGSAPYAVTKHAALSFAEWIRITHGHQGIGVSCLCPQGVRTRMLLGEINERADGFLVKGSVSPQEAAECVVQGIDAEHFLILPHPEVAEFFRRKGADYDRWLGGMQRLAGRVQDGYQVERPGG